MRLKNVLPMVMATGLFVTNDGFVFKHQLGYPNYKLDHRRLHAASVDGGRNPPLATEMEFNRAEYWALQREAAMTQRIEVSSKAFEVAEGLRQNYDNFFLLIAVLPPLLAYLAWPEIAGGVSTLIDQFTSTYRNVDGNAFAVQLLRPTINGVVLPVLSIGTGTLLATTVNVLRTRQVDMRASINKEVCELRLLRRAILGMFGTTQHARRRAKALRLLLGYTQQLIEETRTGAVEKLVQKQGSGGISENQLDGAHL